MKRPLSRGPRAAQWLPAVIALAAAAALGVAMSGCALSDDVASGSTMRAPAHSAGATSRTATALAQTPGYNKILAAANREGVLNLNWAFSMGNPSPMVNAFRKAYPRIKLTITPSPNQSSNLARLVQEYRAGKPASSDAFVGVPALVWALGPAQANVLQSVNWAAFAPWTKGLASSSDGVGLSIYDQFSAFTYNTTQFKPSELPKTSADILRLKQPIASTPYAAQFNLLAIPGALGQRGVENYLARFKPKGFIGCNDLNRVASGEFAALWISCGTNISDIFAARGAPLKNVIIRDAAVTFPWYGAVPKNSAHPNAAKIWIAWLDSPVGQKLLFQHEKADNRRIRGSQTAKQLARFEARGIKFTGADYHFVTKHHDVYTRAYTAKLVGILTKRG